MLDNVRKRLYNTVLSQALSDCGEFLFAGNNFGDIFIVNISTLQKTNDDYSTKNNSKKTYSEPVQAFNLGNDPISSLGFHRSFLIVGTLGKVVGVKWDEDKKQLIKVAWEITIPTTTEAIESPDVNCFWLDKVNDDLYAGCGDNIVYLITLDEGRIVRNFKGPKDYIHDISFSDNKLYAASEDGSIMSWSGDDEMPIMKLKPYTNENLMRPEFGKWQGTVSVMNDWLVCGGGPKSCMWHLRSMECTNVLPFPGKAHCSNFVDDLIFVGGENNFVHQYTFNGDLTAEIPISGSAAYSLLCQTDPVKFMSIAGATNLLDICTNFNYKDVVVNLYKAVK